MLSFRGNMCSLISQLIGLGHEYMSASETRRQVVVYVRVHNTPSDDCTCRGLIVLYVAWPVVTKNVKGLQIAPRDDRMGILVGRVLQDQLPIPSCNKVFCRV